MTEEIKKLRDGMAEERMKTYLPDFKPLVGAYFCAGFDAAIGIFHNRFHIMENSFSLLEKSIESLKKEKSALVAKIVELESITDFACLTGDCDHNNQAECNLASFRLLNDLKKEKAAQILTKAPWNN